MPTRDWRSLSLRLLQHLMRNQSLWAPGGVWSQGWNLKELTEGHHQEWSLRLNLTHHGETQAYALNTLAWVEALCCQHAPCCGHLCSSLKTQVWVFQDSCHTTFLDFFHDSSHFQQQASSSKSKCRAPSGHLYSWQLVSCLDPRSASIVTA